jgi:hypothetical protein
MKKLILFIAIACFIFCSAEVMAKKAGEVEGDTLYIDNNFDFSVHISEGWKFKKVGGDDDIRRLIILKRSPVIPMHFGNDRSYFTPPMMTILADSTDLSVDSLYELIQSMEANDIEIVEEALDNFSLPLRTSFSPEYGIDRDLRIGAFEGIKVEIQKSYVFNINDQFRQAPRRVSDYIRGIIFILKKDNQTIIAEGVCERERFGFNERDFDAMIESLDNLNKDQSDEKEEVEKDKQDPEQKESDTETDDKSKDDSSKE